MPVLLGRGLVCLPLPILLGQCVLAVGGGKRGQIYFLFMAIMDLSPFFPLRYDILPSWSTTVDGHYMNGTAGLSEGLNSGVGLEDWFFRCCKNILYVLGLLILQPQIVGTN